MVQYTICRQLGKPTEYEWRGVTSLPGWDSYEEWEGEKKKARLFLAGDLPKDLLVGSVSLDKDGADLLSVSVLNFELHVIKFLLCFFTSLLLIYDNCNFASK